MKVYVFFLALLFWFTFIIFIKTQIEFSYNYEKLTSKISISFKMMFFKYRIMISLPKENTIRGLDKIIDNIITDMANEEEIQETNSRRYRKAKKTSGSIVRNIFNSWLKVIWLKRKLSYLQQIFFKKIKLHAFNLNLLLGCEDAAHTGIMIGSLWILFGQIASRLYRMITVTAERLNINLAPDFNQKILLCSANCILSLQISHIIFTAYKFLGIILQSRRNN